jgi:hypothetical protein
MSQYFNINMLDDYLDLGLKFKVYVDGEYLVVNDPWDLLNDYKAVGYDSKGDAVEFEYMDVDHIMIGSNVFTKDELNNIDKKQGDEEGGGEEGATDIGGEPGSVDVGSEPAPPEEEAPTEKEPEEEKPNEEKPDEEQ